MNFLFLVQILSIFISSQGNLHLHDEEMKRNIIGNDYDFSRTCEPCEGNANENYNFHLHDDAFLLRKVV